jgi:hypothetical protein
MHFFFSPSSDCSEKVCSKGFEQVAGQCGCDLKGAKLVEQMEKSGCCEGQGFQEGLLDQRSSGECQLWTCLLV